MNLFEYTYDLVRQIPPRKVSTYGAVAEALGDRVAARAVGRMMNQNPDPGTMPCYKIVHADGRLGGFGGGITEKIRRLHRDGIRVEKGKLVDFEKAFFHDFQTTYPLRALRQEQLALEKKLRLADDPQEIETVAGVDVAYPDSEFEEACGACVVLDYHTKRVVETQVTYATTDFPFISTYFSYRELPIVERVMNKVSRKPSILLLDGNGILHPARCGFACQAGLQLDVPTIGVAKTLLYGTVKGSVVTIDNEPRGIALSVNHTHPVFVSPGHRVSLPGCRTIVKNLCVFKNPEPLRLAHRLAKEGLLKRRKLTA
ncbi:MAG TPA: endonuclease V [Candidatus Thermoplasmatota archaeon]|nr:endonuclease V [Candidatus Thermoplasmatota archaeon]